MLLKITLILVLLLAVLAGVIATRPAAFRYTRTLSIAAPPEELFGRINDLRRFQEWNPWAKVDPSAAITYAGPASGPGASYSWAGNSQVGEGTMTITEIIPREKVTARMDFRKPMAAVHTAEFTFRPEGAGTVAEWSMHGENNFMGKAFGLFVDCDKMVGGEFAKGLATLKSLAESGPALPAPAAAPPGPVP